MDYFAATANQTRKGKLSLSLSLFLELSVFLHWSEWESFSLTQLFLICESTNIQPVDQPFSHGLNWATAAE